MSVRRAFIWSVVGQVVSLVTLLAAIAILARILDPRAMGAFAVGQATGAILTAVGSIGIGSYIIRTLDAEQSVRSSAFSVGLGIGAALAAATIASAAPVAKLLGEPNMVAPLRWIALLPLISAFEIVPLAIAQREMRFGALALVAAARSTTMTVVAISTALAGEVYMCVAYAMVAGALVGAVGAHIATPGQTRLKPGLAHFRPIAHFSLQTFLAGGTGMLASRLSEVMVGALTGLAALGIYSRASTIYTTLYGSLFGSISRVLLVRLADAIRTGDSVRVNYTAALDALLALFWPALLGIAILAGPIVYWAFGPSWTGAALPLSLLMVAQAIAMLFSLSYELAMLRNRVAQQVRYEIFRSIAGLAFVAIGCNWGIAGAAAGKLCELLLAAVLYVPLVIEMTGMDRSEYLTIVKRNAVPTLASLTPAGAYMVATDFPIVVPMGSLAAIVAAGVAAWLATLILQRHRLAGEFQQLFRLPR